MTVWPVEKAGTRFGALLAACLEQGPQVVTSNGTEAAVLVPIEEWRRLSAASPPTLKGLLLAENPRAEIPVPERGRKRRRTPEPLD